MTNAAMSDANHRVGPARIAVVGDLQAVATAGWIAITSGVDVAVSSPWQGHVTTVQSLDGASTAATVRSESAPQADLWIVVTRSALLDSVLDQHGRAMLGGQVLLAPGGFGGTLRFTQWFERNALVAPAVAECTGFPAMGVVTDTTIAIRAVKRHLPLAAHSSDQTSSLLATFQPLLPDLMASDLATTSLGNTNHLIHPPLVVTNAVRIAAGERFTFYRQGITEGVRGLLAAVDEERQAVVRAWGGDSRSGVDWMNGFYGDQGMQGSDLVTCLGSFPPFATTPSPPALDYRYLTDDVPFGIAAWAELGQRLGIATPHLQALTVLAQSLLGQQLQPPTSLVSDVCAHWEISPSHDVFPQNLDDQPPAEHLDPSPVAGFDRGCDDRDLHEVERMKS